MKHDLSRAAMRAAMNFGLARIEAVRAALGTSARLMIDCHWRFDKDGANELLHAVSHSTPYWIECPIPETLSSIESICRLRHTANAAGIRLAGLETRIRAEGFMPYLTAGAYDVMMPDVKYAGGPEEMLRIAALLEKFDVAFSPHNPMGPICHVQSLHLCAALRHSDLLEHQSDETAVFGALLDAALPDVEQGMAMPDWERPGLGIDLVTDSLLVREVPLVDPEPAA